MIPVVFIVLRSPGTYRYFLSMTSHCRPNNSDCAVTHECFNFGGNYYIIYIQVRKGQEGVLFFFLSPSPSLSLRRFSVLFRALAMLYYSYSFQE